jgi:hypothetical protein
MSSSTENLPADYTPYRELEFCSNRFVNTLIAIEVEGHVPLWVGAGAGPRVWLSAPAGTEKRRWTPVVVDNRSRVPDVQVKSASQGRLEVFAGETRVLEAREIDAQRAAVTWLDLRPLGFNIHGNSSVLWIGTNQFSRNHIANCKAAIGIGAQTL